MCSRALARRVRVQRVPVLSPGSAGMTLGRLILLRKDGTRNGTSQLLAHELIHVRQYYERGVGRFLFRYLTEYLRNLLRTRSHRTAYHKISFEQQAYAEAESWTTRHSSVSQIPLLPPVPPRVS